MVPFSSTSRAIPFTVIRISGKPALVYRPPPQRFSQ
nr:MAG TPA: hypothetical protein [Caudoviricetes sp.]